MPRKCLSVLVAVLLCAACTSTPEPAARRAAEPSAAPTVEPTPEAPGARAGPTTYLALGDSVAAGVGASQPDTGGYVPLLAGLLSDRLGCDDGAPPGCPLQLRNLATSGATTGTLLRDQLPHAVGLLSTDPDVRLVTVTIGGNDVVEPVLRGCARDPQGPECAVAVGDALLRADAGLDRVLGDLAAAAPVGTTVAVMTYYDPVPACRLAPLQPLAEQVLEGTAGRPGLNDLIRTRAAEHGAVVVETAGQLSAPGDVVGGEDCLHPSGAGHGRIAEAFAAVTFPVLGGA